MVRTSVGLNLGGSLQASSSFSLLWKDLVHMERAWIVNPAQPVCCIEWLLSSLVDSEAHSWALYFEQRGWLYPREMVCRVYVLGIC